MAIELPEEFTNIPLKLLWRQLKVVKELKDLSSAADDKAYWDGWYDSIAALFSDLTLRPTVSLRPELANIYHDFQMEDRLLELEQELREENGGL